MKVTLIQSDIYWEDPNLNKSKLDTLFLSLNKTDLIILPEMFSTGFTMNLSLSEDFNNSSTIEWLKSWSNKLDCCIIGTLPIKDLDKYYNRLVFIRSDGSLSYYDKRHTFSYSGEDRYYTKGSNKLIESYLGFSILPLICYDLRFPVFSRNRFIDNRYDYDLLIYVASWPSSRIEHWKSLLKARAIENQSYVIGVNRIGSGGGLDYSGDSCIISPYGDVLWSLSGDVGICEFELDKLLVDGIRNKFPFLRDSDDFTIVY